MGGFAAELDGRRSGVEPNGQHGGTIVSGAGGRYAGLMRADGVEVATPFLDERSGLLDGIEDLAVEQLVAETGID